MRTLFLMLFLIAIVTPAGAEDYLMIGLYDVSAAGKNSVCAAREMEKVPLKSKADYGAASDDFYKSHKGQSPFTKLLTPDTAAVVFKYKTFKYGWNCEHDVLSIQTAHDVEVAKEKMENIRKEKPKAFRSEPQAVLTWEGSEYKSTVQKSYGGVEITFTARRGNAGKTIVTAKGRNTNKDRAASVVFSGQGVTASGPIVLQPGASFSKPVGTAEDIDFEVGFGSSAHQGNGSIGEVIDYGKEKIRDHLKTNDGGIRYTPAAIGPRG